MKSIRVDNVTKIYDLARSDERAVDRVSLDVTRGELFFLLGPSGCGKSTLLRMIAGLTWPNDGRIFLGDRDVTDAPARKRNTAMVFQNYALWPHMTVDQNVQFGPKMKGAGSAERKHIAQEYLGVVQMAELARRKPVQLSGGQQQRVALARALAAGPDCLLLDEPLSNLDAKLRLQMRGELRRIVKDTHATAVYVTHDQKEALSMADRIAVMDAGQIVQVGTPEDVYHRPRTRFVADFLGEANFIDGQVRQAEPTVVVETALGRLEAQASEPVRVGQTVTCCVRPERVAVWRSGEGGLIASGAVWRATVVERVFLGEVAQYTCRFANGDTWRVTILGVSSRSQIAEGADVDLSISRAHVVSVES